MDIKEVFGKIVSAITKGLKYLGGFFWSIITGVATVITFLIIFALLSLIISFKFVWILSLCLLLWFVYANRQKVGTIIAVLIAFVLSLMLFNAMKYSLFPGWLIKKSSVVFEFNLSGRDFGSKKIKDKELENLTFDGSVDLYSVSIKRMVKVGGQLSASLLKANGRVAVDGFANLNDINLKSDLVVDGSLVLNKGVVSGLIKVNGSANLDDIECKKSIIVDGSLVLNKGNISGKIFVDGSVDINESKMKDLIVCGEKINIGTSTVKSIRVKKLSENETELQRKQVVKLVGSKVEGNIVFDSGIGEVILQGESSVGGKVAGGKVVKN